MAEQKVIYIIKNDNYISSSELLVVHISKLLFIFVLGCKLLGCYTLGALSILDPSLLAVCIKILYNSTTYNLISFWFGAFTNTVLV